MASNEKLYPFSVSKHAHDIEYYHNHLYCAMRDMEDGYEPMDVDRYDRIFDLYYGELQELYEKMFDSQDGRIVYLTGKQIALAKKIVFWASDRRASHLADAEKTEYLQYC